jgi:hypothetical protein
MKLELEIWEHSVDFNLTFVIIKIRSNEAIDSECLENKRANNMSNEEFLFTLKRYFLNNGLVL